MGGESGRPNEWAVVVYPCVISANSEQESDHDPGSRYSQHRQCAVLDKMANVVKISKPFNEPLRVQWTGRVMNEMCCP